MKKEKLTENFYRHEFACQGKNCCGNSSPISLKFVECLQRLHDVVSNRLGKKASLVINSGFRCNKHNASIGGAPDSRHTFGDAADVRTPIELTDEEFFHCAEQVPEFKNGGIGRYKGRLHLDTRGEKARW